MICKTCIGKSFVAGMLSLSLFEFGSRLTARAQDLCASLTNWEDKKQCYRQLLDAERVGATKELIDRCGQFALPKHRQQCLADELAAKNSEETDKEAKPYCMPIVTADIARIQAGHRVVVPGIDGCWMEFNN